MKRFAVVTGLAWGYVVMGAYFAGNVSYYAEKFSVFGKYMTRFLPF